MTTPTRIALRRSAFRAWLAGQEPDKTVGFRCRCAECPLARFLAVQGAVNPSVIPKNYTIDLRDNRRRRTPPWARSFLRMADREGRGPVTAAEALAVLESIGP